MMQVLGASAPRFPRPHGSPRPHGFPRPAVSSRHSGPQELVLGPTSGKAEEAPKGGDLQEPKADRLAEL